MAYLQALDVSKLGDYEGVVTLGERMDMQQ
jgi:hypothetical protein